MTNTELQAHPGQKVLTITSINNNIKNVEYAVRGKIAIRGEEIREELTRKLFPLKTVVNCNIGNPQQLNQKPITFFRQVASLYQNPDLLSDDNAPLVSQLYQSDAISRVKQLLNDIGPSIGAYSQSQGIPAIRRTVAKFLQQRDDSTIPANANHIYLTQGASSGVQSMLSILTQDRYSGIMIPIPQYPLYSATLTLVGATPVPYHLIEQEQWGLDMNQLTRVVQDARRNGTDVRALVIINPGNPTGQCLSMKT